MGEAVLSELSDLFLIDKTLFEHLGIVLWSRRFAWTPVVTEDAGRVWMRKVWVHPNGKRYMVKPEVRVTVSSRPIRIPFGVGAK